MTHLEALTRRLRHVLAGRAQHADAFALTAELQPRRMGDRILTRVYWTDSYTGRTGDLGNLDGEEIGSVLPVLFTQLRQWRTRCQRPQPKAKGAAA